MRLLRRAIRFTRPSTPSSYYILAAILWDQRRFDEALELYRFAACLEDKNEKLAQRYFVAARHLQADRRGAAVPPRPLQRFGKRSSRPARHALLGVRGDRPAREAFEVLEEALALRPDDGELLLFAADAHAATATSTGRDELLAAARGQHAGAAWLRGRRQTWRRSRGELRAALRAVAAGRRRPSRCAMDAHRHLAQLLAETEGRAAALDAPADGRASGSRTTTRCTSSGSSGCATRARRPPSRSIRRLIAIHPADAWARRELALGPRVDQHRLDEALRPRSDGAAGWTRRRLAVTTSAARCCGRAGRTAEAREAYREAIRAVGRRRLRHRRADRRVRHLRRAAGGAGVRPTASWSGRRSSATACSRTAQVARDTLEPEELLRRCSEALEARPDLWHAWAAVVRQLTSMDRLDEAPSRRPAGGGAVSAAAAALAGPGDGLPRRGDARGRDRGAASRRCRSAPAGAWPSRQLAEVHERDGAVRAGRGSCWSRRSPARRSTPSTTAAWPTCSGSWARRRRRWSASRRRCGWSPGYDWAWGTLRSGRRELGRPEAAEIRRAS